MKNMDRLLLAIKMECDKQKKLAEIRCFDKLAERSGIPRHHLPMCLEELQDLGYIKYSLDDDFLYLTRRGMEYIA